MEYRRLAEFYSALEATTSRNRMIQLLTDLFRETPRTLLGPVVYLSAGRIAPEFTGLEYNFGEKLAIRSLARVLSVEEHEVEEKVIELGDIGDAGYALFTEKGYGRGGGLTVEEVFRRLVEIAKTSGAGAIGKKLELFSDLISRATPLEVKYLLRTVTEKLRLGIGDNTILEALSLAFTGSRRNRPDIERAYNLTSDLGYVAQILAEKGIEGVRAVRIEVGRPIRPMLAERMSVPALILKKLGGRCGAEFKYDGERIQAHRKGDRMWLFSRRLENITHQFPDLSEFLKEAIDHDFIVELECVVIDPVSAQIEPFQTLMNRKVKHVTRFHIVRYPVAGFLFDLLYLDGEDMTLKPYPERRRLLEEVVKVTDRISLAERKIIDNLKDLEAFFHRAVEEGCEGLVCKSLAPNSIYEAGKRGFLWIKYKRDYRSQLADTLDLVVVGAFHGRGQRAGHFGSLLMACYDPEGDQFKTVCKVGTGFSEEDFLKLERLLGDRRIAHRHPRVNSFLSADMWFEPSLVLEITGAELTLSPVHTCGWGKVEEGRGLGLRFPRFTGRYRFDKRPEDATTEGEILEMFQQQRRFRSY